MTSFPCQFAAGLPIIPKFELQIPLDSPEDFDWKSTINALSGIPEGQKRSGFDSICTDICPLPCEGEGLRVKPIKKLLTALLIIAALLLQVPAAQACTTILVTDTSGRAYHGRTLEFSVLLPMDMTYFPAGTKVISSTPAGNRGLTFDTKYSILGMSYPVLPSAKQVTFVEGINDQGVSFSANWLTGTDSPAVGQDGARILAASDFGAWVLGNFKSVEEVKEAMGNG